MKHRSLRHCQLLASLIVALCCLAPAGSTAQDKAKVSDGEAKAAKAVEASVDVNAKLLAAEAFVKKYPKSSLRQRLVDLIADQVFDQQDAAQRLALAQKALAIFNAESEVAAFKPAVIDGLAKLERYDEAFAEGAAFLAKNPDNIQILVNLAITGTERAKLGNGKYVTQSREYGLKAIELIEADKKPADMIAAVWDKFKATLPQLQQEMAIISMMQQNEADAQTRLEVAVKLKPADPFNYVLLASIANREYQKAGESYKSMMDGKAKDDARVKVNALMDKVIDLYAHAVALSEGKAGYERLHDSTLGDMTNYYKFRHQNSTDGMQKLIDGYKLP
jgi:hypothetical protein